MASETSDVPSLATLSTTGIELFPRRNNEDRSPFDAANGSDCSSDHLHDLFHKPTHDEAGDGEASSAEEAPRNTHANVSSYSSASTDYRKYDNDVDVDITDLPSSSSLKATPSYNSSVMNSIRAKVAQSPDIKGKLKYVDLYEKAMRERNPELQGTSDVFGLEKLDDFSRFMELSRINHDLASRLRPANEEQNMLTVLESRDLDRYYDEGHSDAGTKTGKKRTYKKLSRFAFWKRSKPENKEHGYEPAASKGYLQRRLEVRHLQMISLGGTLGVGLYLNSGKAFTIAGGFGALLAFTIVGLIVLVTVNSFCEMVTFVSVVDGVSGLSSRFVDESFGFATGWLYFLSFSFGLTGEVVASVIILGYFPETGISESAGATAGFVTLFLVVCIVSNMINVRIFGEIEYLCSLVKVIITLGGIIVMIVINRGALGKEGAVGFKYWTYSKSNFEHSMIFGLFRPTFDLDSDGLDSTSRGIGGALGRFLSILTAIVIASYAYSGTEIVCIAACEAKDPRKALPSATKRVFWRILLFYCLSSFVVSLNIYAGDPRLLRYYSGKTGISPEDFSNNFAIQAVGGNNCHHNVKYQDGVISGSQSPWVVAFQSVGLCKWSDAATVLLFFVALSCGNSHLYVSSRTLYSLALQNKAPSFLKRCNRHGIPYCSVLVSALPGLAAFTCVSQQATVVFQNLTSVISSSGVFVWFAMCVSFVRFYYGLTKRPDIIGRDDKSYPYRSPLQPYSAIFGVFGTSVILICMGYVVFLKGHWNTMFFFASYGTFFVFAILYMGHRLVKGSTILSLEALDFDSGKREKDMYIWDGGKEYNIRSVKDIASKVVGFMA